MGQLSQGIPEKWKIKYYVVKEMPNSVPQGSWRPKIGKPDLIIYGDTKLQRLNYAKKMIEGFIDKYLKPDEYLESALICETNFDGRKIALYDRKSTEIIFY